jgi:hypothetical protein
VGIDTRKRRDLHALDDNGMLICNPRDREAAHRAEVEGIATPSLGNVTCKKCLKLMRSVAAPRRKRRRIDRTR